MRYSDYHLHSEYSFDSNEKIDNICKKALVEDIKEIVITDHLEVQDKDTYPDFRDRKKEILRLTERYRGELVIKSGVEIGQPHYDYSAVQKIVESSEFDFILASLHIVKEFGAPSKYAFKKDNTDRYLKRYLNELEEIASEAEYDVLAHVTLPFRYIPGKFRNSFAINNYEELYRKIFQTVVRRNKGIEINASGIRTDLKQTFPSLEVLKWYEEEGGKIVTLGSDGHSAKSAFLCLDQAFSILQQTTIGVIAHYSKRNLSYENIKEERIQY